MANRLAAEEEKRKKDTTKGKRNEKLRKKTRRDIKCRWWELEGEVVESEEVETEEDENGEETSEVAEVVPMSVVEVRTFSTAPVGLVAGRLTVGSARFRLDPNVIESPVHQD